MAISHNPIFNRSLSTGLMAQQEQQRVDDEFARITNPMTVEGTSSKVFAMFLAVLAGVTATWVFNLSWLFLPAMFVGLGLGMWASFSKQVRPGVMLAYALVQGVFVGGISLLFEASYPGIAQTAVVATLVTAGAMFLAYRFGLVRVNAKFTRFMMFAIIGYFAFSMINLGFALFTNNSIYSSQWGWIAALIGVGLAAFTLNLDFEQIRVGVQQRWPEEMEWRAAFGLTASLLWLYVEILRLLAIFNRE